MDTVVIKDKLLFNLKDSMLFIYFISLFYFQILYFISKYK